MYVKYLHYKGYINKTSEVNMWNDFKQSWELYILGGAAMVAIVYVFYVGLWLVIGHVN